MVIKGLRIDPSRVVFVGMNRMDIVVEVDSRDVVLNAVPDMALLAQIKVRAISLMSKEDDERPHDITSRLFAPAEGVPEDPFCGSAHCYLGPYWMDKLGKAEMTGLMLSNRTGVTKLTVQSEKKRVLLQGVAEVSWTGKMHSGPFQQH
mmetsp:Transcript_9583/g.16833  ORF Transcript_9583/g.16833 Transcript_9583/m.16833 type:complete len:148 (-) Transcript_9583:22-465(-)